MIKGRYVATVVIDIAVPEDTPDLLPFEEIRAHVFDDTAEEIINLIQGYLDSYGTVTVTQQYADVYRCSDEDTGEQ